MSLWVTRKETFKTLIMFCASSATRLAGHDAVTRVRKCVGCSPKLWNGYSLRGLRSVLAAQGAIKRMVYKHQGHRVLLLSVDFNDNAVCRLRAGCRSSRRPLEPIVNHMLQAKKKFFVPVYHFFENDDYFGTLRASFFLPNATLIAQDGNYRFHREKWFEGKYYCTFNYNYKAFAEKPNGIGYAFWIKYQSFLYLLKPGKLFDEKSAFHFELFENDSLCGVIIEKPTRYFLSIEIDREISQIVKCFIFWLGYRSYVCQRGWNREPGVARVFSRF